MTKKLDARVPILQILRRDSSSRGLAAVNDSIALAGGSLTGRAVLLNFWFAVFGLKILNLVAISKQVRELCPQYFFRDTGAPTIDFQGKCFCLI